MRKAEVNNHNPDRSQAEIMGSTGLAVFSIKSIKWSLLGFIYKDLDSCRMEYTKNGLSINKYR